MSRIRSATVALLAVSSLVMTSQAAADPWTNSRSRVLGHSYAAGNHHAWGTMRISMKNLSERERVRVRCHVFVIWENKRNEATYEQVSGGDYVTVTVRAGHPRVRHFRVTAPDPGHLVRNIPGRWDTGCR